MDFATLHSPEPEAAPPSPRSIADNDPSKFRFKRRSSIKVGGAAAVPDADDTAVFAMAFSDDSRFLAAGCGDGSLRVFNSVGRLSYVMNTESRSKLPATCVRFRPPSSQASAATKNVLVVASAEGTVSHYHLTTQKLLHTIEERDNQVLALQYRPDGEAFATAGRDGKVRVYDENTKTLVSILSDGASRAIAGHSSRVFALKYKPNDTNLLLSGGWDNQVLMWDMRVGQAVRSIYGPHLCGDALDVRGDRVLTGSWRPHDALQLWDFGTGELLQNVPWTREAAGGEAAGEDGAASAPAPEPEMLYCASFSPDGNFIAAGGSGTCEGKLFDANNEFRAVDRQFMGDKGVYSLAFAPNGRKLALAGGSRNIAMLDLAA